MSNGEISDALAPYGAFLNENGFIQKGVKATSVKIVQQGKRLRFEGNGALLASGPATAKAVQQFVEKFWFWKAETKTNPARRQKIGAAQRLLKSFSGAKSFRVGSIAKPNIPDTVIEIGPCIGIMYATVRDGKREKYLHRFADHAQPLLAVSHDGRQLLLLGGSYNFTARGIEDRKRRKS